MKDELDGVADSEIVAVCLWRRRNQSSNKLNYTKTCLENEFILISAETLSFRIYMLVLKAKQSSQKLYIVIKYDDGGTQSDWYSFGFTH